MTVTAPSYEIGLPTGAYAGQPYKATMLCIHGGGWASDPVGGIPSMRPHADRYRAKGWRTYNIDYMPGPSAIPYVLAFYDMVDAGTTKPVGVMGASAGGHLALMVSVLRAVKLVISMAGPTKLDVLPGAPTAVLNEADPTTWAFGGARNAFGLVDYFPYVSPIERVSEICASTWILSGNGVNDPVVPADQMVGFKYARPTNTNALLMQPPAEGTTGPGFVHVQCSAASWTTWINGENDALTRTAP